MQEVEVLEHADVGAFEPFKQRARSPFLGLRLLSLGTRMSARVDRRTFFVKLAQTTDPQRVSVRVCDFLFRPSLCHSTQLTFMVD